MSRLSVLTPSYAPDFSLFELLHRSVLAYTDEQTVHHAVVPDRDFEQFSGLQGARLQVHRASSLLPGRFVPIPRANAWINVSRPWPPVRGWIMQQVLKLAAAARLDADVVMLADSDVCLTRRVRTEDLEVDGRIRLFRDVGAVHVGMPRHLLWHEVARRLLDLPPAPSPPLHDYVSPVAVWRPSHVRDMLARLERVSGADWRDVVGRQLHFSEFILQGVYLDALQHENVAGTPESGCHTYWDEVPLDATRATRVVQSRAASDFAVMISARSGTPLEVRLHALADVLPPR